MASNLEIIKNLGMRTYQFMNKSIKLIAGTHAVTTHYRLEMNNPQYYFDSKDCGVFAGIICGIECFVAFCAYDNHSGFYNEYHKNHEEFKLVIPLLALISTNIASLIYEGIRGAGITEKQTLDNLENKVNTPQFQPSQPPITTDQEYSSKIEQQKIVWNGKELSDTEQEAWSDIVTRFKNLE